MRSIKIESNKPIIIQANNFFQLFEICRNLDPKSYNFVYEDEMSKEGWLKGMVKMNQVFELMTKEFNL